MYTFIFVVLRGLKVGNNYIRRMISYYNNSYILLYKIFWKSFKMYTRNEPQMKFQVIIQKGYIHIKTRLELVICSATRSQREDHD